MVNTFPFFLHETFPFKSHISDIFFPLYVAILFLHSFKVTYVMYVFIISYFISIIIKYKINIIISLSLFFYLIREL